MKEGEEHHEKLLWRGLTTLAPEVRHAALLKARRVKLERRLAQASSRALFERAQGIGARRQRVRSDEASRAEVTTLCAVPAAAVVEADGACRALKGQLRWLALATVTATKAVYHASHSQRGGGAARGTGAGTSLPTGMASALGLHAGASAKKRRLRLVSLLDAFRLAASEQAAVFGLSYPGGVVGLGSGGDGDGDGDGDEDGDGDGDGHGSQQPHREPTSGTTMHLHAMNLHAAIASASFQSPPSTAFLSTTASWGYTGATGGGGGGGDYVGGYGGGGEGGDGGDGGGGGGDGGGVNAKVGGQGFAEE